MKQECHLNSIEFRSEIKTVYLKKDDCPVEILSFINENKLQDTFSNVWVALRIMITISVTTVSYEKNCSKLILIKIYLKSSMTEERLNNLAIISLKNYIASQ